MQEKREDIRGERREKFDNLSMLGQISDAEGRRAAKKRRDSRLFEVFKGLIFSPMRTLRSAEFMKMFGFYGFLQISVD